MTWGLPREQEFEAAFELNSSSYRGTRRTMGKKRAIEVRKMLTMQVLYERSIDVSREHN